MDNVTRLIQDVLTDDLLTTRWRKLKKPDSHFTFGHCYVAAESAYYLLGGKDEGWQSYVLPKQVLGFTHWWIQNKRTGKRVDPTAEQFAIPVPYENGRPCGFLTNKPSKRCEVLLERLQEKYGISDIYSNV